MGWPGFFLAAPEVQNTARNTDGFWVIHGGASRDTNKLLQDVAPLLPTDLPRMFAALLLVLYLSCASKREAQKKNVIFHPCDIVTFSPPVSSI